MQNQLTPEQQAFLDKYEIKTPQATTTSTNQPLTPEQQAFLDKYEIKPKDTGMRLQASLKKDLSTPESQKLHDFTAGIVNPWINMANLIPYLHLKTMQPYQKGSLYDVAGNLVGGIAPFLTGEGAIVKGVSYIPKFLETLGATGKGLDAVKSAAAIAQRASPLRSAAVGSAIGYAASPDEQREQNALMGGLSAGLLHGAGLGLGAGSNYLLKTPVMKKAVQYFEPPLSVGTPAEGAKEASEAIADNYTLARKKAEDMYNDSTVAANLKGVKFNKNDFPSYAEEYKRQQESQELPTTRVISPDNLIKKTAPEEKTPSLLELPKSLKDELMKKDVGGEPQTLLPTQVHKMRSDLRRYARSAPSGFDRDAYNKLANALNRDYSNKVAETDERLATDYDKANNYWRDVIKGKFENHKAFKKMKNALTILPGSPALEDDISNLHKLNWHGADPSDLINNLIPRNNKSGASILESFQNDLMNGDKEKTAQIAKNLMFSKYIKSLNGGELTPEEIETPNYKFNMYQFLKHYGDLGEEQKNYLFKPEERKVLNILEANKNSIKKPGILQNLAKKGIGGLLGYAVAAKSGGTIPTKVMAELSGAALASPVERAAHGAAQLFLPSELKGLLPKLESYQPNFKTTRLPAALSLGLPQAYQNWSGGNTNANQ